MKGQTAIEYLMTYGWAILIILIVAGVLAYYGIFAPAGFLAPTARGFGQVQVLNPWSIAATGGATSLYMENRVGGQITVDTITLDVGNGAVTCTPTGGVVIDSGAKAVVTCTPAAGTWTDQTPGESYTATITISYTFQSATFTSTGTISGTYS